MIIFIAIISFIIIVLLYMRFEATWVQVNNIYFTKSSECLKILHLSDIHDKFLMVPVKKIRKAIKAADPDVIILTGDYIEKPVDISSFLEKLQYIKSGYRTFICMGNHDYNAFRYNPSGMEAFIKELSALQSEVLVNRSAVVEKNNTMYNIIGIDDLNTGKPDIAGAMKNIAPYPAVNIAISHNPDIAYELEGKKVDYLFTGHFHGGQIWLPFNLEFKLLRNEKLCKAGIKRGLHHFKGTVLYISRGLGNVVIPLRFMSRPEITVYHIP